MREEGFGLHVNSSGLYAFDYEGFGYWLDALNNLDELRFLCFYFSLFESSGGNCLHAKQYV